MRKTIKQILLILCPLILGPILCYGLSILWYSGANTFWKPIDYFPSPVKDIVAMKPYGRGFWVETTNNEIYQITYPCLKDQICWTKSENVPSDFLEGIPAKNEISNNECKNNNFVYPLFHKIRMCITSTVYEADASSTASLVLTTNNKLWMWNSHAISPYTMLANRALLIIIGAVLGLFTSILLIIKSR